MIYRLFLYNTSAINSDVGTIEAINSAISENSKKERTDNEAYNSLKSFDVQKVKMQILDMLGDKCRVIVKHPP